jgi:hypothetical protein
MKEIYVLIISILYANITMAQTEPCRLTGTKWGIKNIAIERTGGSIDDSISKVKFYQKFYSTELNFYTKKKVMVSWRQYKIYGLYKIKETAEGKVLVFTKWKHFGFYENGSFERSEFAVFLYPFKSRGIPFLKDCSFMMLSKSGGIDCEIVYEKVK